VPLRSVIAGLVLLAVGWLPAKAGELDSLRGRRIKTIHFDSQGLDFSEALKFIDCRPGDRFSIRAIRRSVKLLYYTGLFGQVRVTAVVQGAEIELTFHLQPKRKVLAVKFLGNQALDEDQLKRLSRLNRGDEYDRWKMDAAAIDMIDLYRKQGYRRTQIIAKAEGPENGDVTVRYYVQEGPATRISRLWFKGEYLYRPERLSDAMDLKPNDILSDSSVQKGITQLRSYYWKNEHLEVKVVGPDLEHELEALWAVVPVEVQAGPKIMFEFEGNQMLNAQKLRGEISIDKETKFDSFTLQDLAENFEKLYQEIGFAKVRVTYREKLNESGSLKRITFVIDEGNRVSVKEIRFEGNRAFRDEKLSGYIFNAMLDAIPQALINQPIDRGDLDQLGGGHPLTGVERRVNRPQGFITELVPETVYLREPYEKALSQIADLYQSQGYLDVVVEDPLLSFDASGSNVYISIPINEGPQTLVESISFEGNQSLSSTRLFEVADRLTGLVRPGQPLNLYGVEQLRKELARTYAKQGYIYCHVEHAILFSKDQSLGGVVFKFDEGPRVRVGRVLVRGNIVTDPAVFENVLTIKSGHYFSPEEVAASQEALYGLETFSGVDIKVVDPEVVESVKDVVVTVREHLPHAMSFSAGISSAEGARLELSYTHRNLFGYALEFVGRGKINYQVFYDLDNELRQVYEDISFWEGLEGLVLTGLHWPQVWLTDLDIAARVDLMFKRDLNPSYDLTKVSLIPGADFRLTDDLVFTIEFELEYDQLGCLEGVEGVECGGATGEKFLRYDEGSLLLGVLRPQLSWDLRDNIFSPHKGVLITFRSELANNFLLDRDVLYIKLDGMATGYIPIGRRTTLALSIRTGFIFNLTDSSRTPTHKLFWLGGRNSVRGFDEEGLIPADQRNPDDPSTPCVVDSTDTQQCLSLGGNASLSLKGELRFPLIPEILEGAIFLDLGNLWVQISNMNPLDLRPTAGFGIRIVTPVGPVAFDFGFNLDPDSSRKEEIWSLHFNIGVF